MKNSFIVTCLLSLMAVLPCSMSAQEESGEDLLSNGFKKIDVRKDFTENGFAWFHEAELLAAGDKEKSNTMTIGWGGIAQENVLKLPCRHPLNVYWRSR